MTKNDTLSAGQVETFLDTVGWSAATRAPITGDASTRRYVRLTRGTEKAVLMLAPPAAETATCPPEASPDDRKLLGYNATARLAGPNLNAFVEISKTLRAADLSAPEIYAANAETGLALIEDFGDDLFARAIELGEDEETLYKAAIDALVCLAGANLTAPKTDHYAMLTYDETALLAETELLADWYWPLKLDADISPDLKREHEALWRDTLNHLSDPHMMTLRDYHAENLLWLPDRAEKRRAGVIDFQDGLFGYGAYDLVSLLEDARRDVDLDFASRMYSYYTDKMKSDANFNQEQFDTDYRILAAQRNAKILGIFARLARRDGKARYLDLLPRVEGHFRRDIERPGFGPLRAFYHAHLPGLKT